MANYCASARSNYFRVRDRGAFERAMDELADLRIADGLAGDGRVCLLCEHPDGGGWPSWRHDERTDEDVEIDLYGLVAGHLADGEVAVFMEAGAEKLRYVVGFAVAVNHRGERREVSLHDIYDLAAQLGPNVTTAEY